MAKLEPLHSLRNIKVGDLFTMISADNEDSLIQFICRDPRLSEDSPFYEMAGYFVEVYGEHKAFRLTDNDLQLGEILVSPNRPKIYVGYDEEFVLEERIKNLQVQINSLQDRLAYVRGAKPKKA